jgi:hypothetical protein
VHGIAATRAQRDSLGIGDVFDVLAVDASERHAVGVKVPAAGAGSRTGSSAGGGAAAAFYLCGSRQEGGRMTFVLKTHQARRRPPSYACIGVGGGDGGGSPCSTPSRTISWRCQRQGDSHVVEWRRVIVPAGQQLSNAPQLSNRVLIDIRAVYDARKKHVTPC